MYSISLKLCGATESAVESGKDPADIAKHALQYAAANHYDVVLVDTAGRMQDNEPLMRALAKLVAVHLDLWPNDWRCSNLANSFTSFSI